jgi:hypothetical protein
MCNCDTVSVTLREENEQCYKENCEETQKYESKMSEASKVKLSLCLSKHYAMKTYRGVDV